MYKIKGRFCSIIELSTKNEHELFALMDSNRPEYTKWVFRGEFSKSQIEFQDDVKKWFLTGRVFQFLIYNNSNKLIGTIFFYGLNKISKKIKCSCYFATESRKSLGVVESLGLTLIFIKEVLRLNSIIFSVYKENVMMQLFAIKAGAKIVAINELKGMSLYELNSSVLDIFKLKLKKLHKIQISFSSG